MTNKELVLDVMRTYGKTAAADLQERAPALTGTEINAEGHLVPDFLAACEKMNMLDRKAGQADGFVCRSSAGRVVRLIQNYDSEVYTQEPEELPAQWRFVWSQDPAHALPFISLATSPYATGDCCTYDGRVWRSGQDVNTWPPGTPGINWEDLGPMEGM